MICWTEIWTNLEFIMIWYYLGSLKEMRNQIDSSRWDIVLKISVIKQIYFTFFYAHGWHHIHVTAFTKNKWIFKRRFKHFEIVSVQSKFWFRLSRCAWISGHWKGLRAVQWSNGETQDIPQLFSTCSRIRLQPRSHNEGNPLCESRLNSDNCQSWWVKGIWHCVIVIPRD